MYKEGKVFIWAHGSVHCQLAPCFWARETMSVLNYRFRYQLDYISSHTFRNGPYVLPKFPVIWRALSVQAAALRSNWRDLSSSRGQLWPVFNSCYSLELGEGHSSVSKTGRTASHRAASQGRVGTGRAGLPSSISNPVLQVC